MAFGIMKLAFRDTWQEFGSILIVHLLFLLGNVLLLSGPPATLALFFYGNRIAHGETASERDFLRAVRTYWGPAWRWGAINFLVMGLLIGDYVLTGKLAAGSAWLPFLQGLYVYLLGLWLLVQLFLPPFLFEQAQPAVLQALRNAAVFVGRNGIFVVMLALLLSLTLAAGTLAFMLTFVFGGALVVFASNHAVLKHLPER